MSPDYFSILRPKSNIGELRDNHFKTLSREELTTIYHKIEMADGDKKEYGWQYFDEHQRLISTQFRPLFLAMDLEMRDLDSVFYNQITTTRQEISSVKTIKTIDRRIFTHDAKKYLIKDDKVNTRRFEYFLYHRVNQGTKVSEFKKRKNTLKLLIYKDKMPLKWYNIDCLQSSNKNHKETLHEYCHKKYWSTSTHS